MRKLHRLVVAALLFTAVAAYAQNAAVDEKEFRAIEKKMFDASVKFLNNDKAEFLALLDDTYFTINADGSAGDKSVLLTAQFPIQKMKIDRIETSDFKLRKYGNVAVITGRSKYFAGPQMLADVLHTQIWVKRAGRWKFAGWQGTTVTSTDQEKH